MAVWLLNLTVLKIIMHNRRLSITSDQRYLPILPVVSSLHHSSFRVMYLLDLDDKYKSNNMLFKIMNSHVDGLKNRFVYCKLLLCMFCVFWQQKDRERPICFICLTDFVLYILLVYVRGRVFSF